MWLVGLGILVMKPMAPSGALGTMFNGFNAPGAVDSTFANVKGHDRTRRRDQPSTWPHKARQSGRQASEELRWPGHACREEGRTYWQGFRARERDKRPFNVWTRPKCSAVSCIAVARPTRRRHGSDRPPSGQEISLRATFKTRRVSQARGRWPRWRRRANVRCQVGECRHQSLRGEV